MLSTQLARNTKGRKAKKKTKLGRFMAKLSTP